jgi:hypothetical protein
MKSAWICSLALIVAGCGAQHEQTDPQATASANTSSPAAVAANVTPANAEFTDERLGLPRYPGATEVEKSRKRYQSATGEMLTVYFQTSDTPAQVAAFYQAEGAKVGTISDSTPPTAPMQFLTIDRPDHSQSAVKAWTEKGATLFSLQRFFPAK